MELGRGGKKESIDEKSGSKGFLRNRLLKKVSEKRKLYKSK